MPDHVTDRLTAFIHDELDEAAAHAAERHLDGCEACRAELVELQRADALVAGWTCAEPPAEIWRAIDAELTRREDRRAFRRWWLAAAALFAVALAVGMLWPRSPEPPRAAQDLTAFLTALEAQPRQENGREFGLLPEGFTRIDPAEAVRAAGLGRSAEDTPTPDSQLYAGRVLEIAGLRIYQLIYGNDDGPYVLFVSPSVAAPGFGERGLSPFPAASPTCMRVASDSLAVFWDSGGGRHWILVGRDHPEALYAEVLRSVAAAFENADEPNSTAEP